MIRHISVFTFFDRPANGKTKEENLLAFEEALRNIPAQYPPIRSYQVGRALGVPPALPEDGPLFGDLIQVADYDTPEDAAGYLPSAAHRHLQELGEPMIQKVTVIDYAI